ncbi:SDR family NAD(P)-dependent oxidoreductase [Plantactinospora sp. CA-294935]|uniref:SDR family NAD(P)-dependent oxidoreductase n=1 Tax=Plantactinospora sp. CA-294935 TaxID=3240012 RepID=UPI003D8EB98D
MSLGFARRDGLDLRIVELDVQDQESADSALKTILTDAGQLDRVVHNAGHLYVGYVEAFTAEDVARLFDINAIGIQRVNRAALPHMRDRRCGRLVYVGSTTSVVVPPFLGPYVASKFAVDALAQVTAYEVGQLGIETIIVMPRSLHPGHRVLPTPTTPPMRTSPRGTPRSTRWSPGTRRPGRVCSGPESTRVRRRRADRAGPRAACRKPTWRGSSCPRGNRADGVAYLPYSDILPRLAAGSRSARQLLGGHVTWRYVCEAVDLLAVPVDEPTRPPAALPAGLRDPRRHSVRDRPERPTRATSRTG